MGRSDVAVADARPSQYYEFSAITIRKRSLALFFLRLPVFVPIIFMVPAWISLNALPVLATANTPSQRKLGKYWKKLQRMTYVIWFFAVMHLLLLDGFRPFGAADGDGIPVFHQRFYWAVAISLPLIVLRLPPVRRWVTD